MPNLDVLLQPGSASSTSGEPSTEQGSTSSLVVNVPLPSTPTEDAPIQTAPPSGEAGQSASETAPPSGESEVNVKSYGAFGDGSTDDTAAIQRAIDQLTAGKRLVFPRGIYVISATLTLPRDNVALVAPQRDATILAADNTNFEHMLFAKARSQIALQGLTFDANQLRRRMALSTRACGVTFIDCTDSTTDACTVRNTVGMGTVVGVGIAFGGVSQRCVVQYCRLEDCGTPDGPSDGVFTSGIENRIRDSIATNCVDTGFVVESSQRSGISDCKSYRCGASFAITNASARDATDNFIERVEGYDWYATVTGGIQIGNPAPGTRGNLLRTRLEDVKLVSDIGPGPAINVRNTGSARTVDLTFTNVAVDGAGKQGILINASNVSLNACRIASTGTCLQLQPGSKNVKVESITMTPRGTFGVVVTDNCDDLQFLDNVIEGSASTAWGMYFFGASQGVVKDRNTIRNTYMGTFGSDGRTPI